VKRRAHAAAAVLLVAGCVMVALVEGVPRHLPGVALGSPVLLQAERVLALLAGTVAALSIAAQAARGRLPIELSTTGLRYEAEAVDDAATAVAEVQEQLNDLALLVVELAERVDDPAGHP
jgi:hypothetical protein